MCQEELIAELNSQTQAFGCVAWDADLPKELSAEIHYSQWDWKGCQVRRYLEDGSFWILLPGFSVWLQVNLGDEC